MKKLFLILVTLAICMAATAQVHSNAGSYGFKFLQNPVSPASLAMAGRGSTINNPSAFVHQPASQAFYRHATVSASHTLWFADTNFTNLSYSNADRVKHFGIILRNLDYGDVESRDESGNLIGNYNPIDMNLMANYSMRLRPDLYAGINAGVLYERLNTASAYGLNTDLGIQYFPPIVDSRINMALRNLGFTSKVNSERIDLPITMELELIKGFKWDDTHLDLGAFGIKAADEDVKAALFTELTVYDIFCIRAAYKLNYAAEDLSAGFGIKISGWSVDYGWAAFSSQLDDVHSLGVSYNF